jgi:putative hydrolase of the HAD superfamily
MQNIKAVILDLGGVLLNIDYEKTRKAFAGLGIEDFNAHYNQFKGSTLFDDLETGKIKEVDFYRAFREQTGLKTKDEQIREAWNAMLLDFPSARVQFLKDLRKKYRLFLLSNTNAIHHDEFQRHFRETSKLNSIDDLFDKAYYSHLIGSRKPETEPFEHILKEQNLKAGETLFIDDTQSNLKGATALGIQTIHLQPPTKVEDLGL